MFILVQNIINFLKIIFVFVSDRSRPLYYLSDRMIPVAEKEGYVDYSGVAME